MPWNSLGTIELTEQWQSFPSDVVNVEVFRIIHTTQVTQWDTVYIARYFPLPNPGGRYSPLKRVYPSTEPMIIELPIPSGYRDQNILVFTLQVKRKLPHINLPWAIEIQALQ